MFSCVNCVNFVLMPLAYQIVICFYVGVCPTVDKFIVIVTVIVLVGLCNGVERTHCARLQGCSLGLVSVL